ADDFDLVLGTRTTRELTCHGRQCGLAAAAGQLGRRQAPAGNVRWTVALRLLVARCLIRRSTAERLPAPLHRQRLALSARRWFAWRCFTACGSSKCRSTTEFASASRRSRAQRVPSPHVGV